MRPPNPDRPQPGRGRPVLRNGAHGERGSLRRRPGLRHLRRHEVGTAEHPPHLDWLEGQLHFPLYGVYNGRSLREDVKTLTNHSGSRRYVDICVLIETKNSGIRGRWVSEPAGYDFSS